MEAGTGTAPGARKAEAGSRPILAVQGHGDGQPAKRRWRSAAQAAMASGVLSTTPCSRLPRPAGSRIQACFWLPQSRPMNPAQAGSGAVMAVSDMYQIPFQRGWLGSGESLIVESRNGKLLSIRFWNQAHPAARTAPRRHRCCRTAEIRSDGMPAPTKVITNVWSIEKPQKRHHASVAKQNQEN